MRTLVLCLFLAPLLRADESKATFPAPTGAVKLHFTVS